MEKFKQTNVTLENYLYWLFALFYYLDLSLLLYFHVYRIVIFSYNASTVVNSFKIYNGYHNCSFCYLFKVNYQFWFFSICTQQFIIDQMKKNHFYSQKRKTKDWDNQINILRNMHIFYRCVITSNSGVGVGFISDFIFYTYLIQNRVKIGFPWCFYALEIFAKNIYIVVDMYYWRKLL